MAKLSELTFMLWNATSINGKEEELGYFISNKNIDIVLITETWLNTQTKLNLANYDIIRADSVRKNAGGVAILINTQLKFHTLPKISIPECDITLIKITSGINLTVGVIYVPPKAQFNFESLSNIIKDYSPIILGGDYNAKHRLWNNYTNNTRGIQLYRYMLNNDVTIIHSNTYTHKLPHRKASNIDIFLTKNVSYTSSCYTENDLTSNHLPVILKFDCVNVSKNELKLSKTDWDEFFGRTDRWRVDYKISSENTIDNNIEKLQKFITKAFKQSSTYQSCKKYKTNIGIEDRAAIDKLIKLRNYYRRKYQRSGINRYKLFRNTLNNHIKVALKEIRNNY